MPKKDEKLNALITKYNEDPQENSFCLDLIIHHYTPYALKLAKDVYYSISTNNGISVEELYAVALSSIHIAVSKCKANEIKSFYSYWKKIAEHQMIAYIDKNSYLKGGKGFKGLFSLDEQSSTGLLAEAFGSYDSTIYTHTLTSEFQNFVTTDQGGLNKKEKKVLSLYLEGYQLFEISRILKIPPSSISYISKRMKEKIKRYYRKK